MVLDRCRLQVTDDLIGRQTATRVSLQEFVGEAREIYKGAVASGIINYAPKAKLQRLPLKRTSLWREALQDLPSAAAKIAHGNAERLWNLPRP
jgi:hypothetical protein